MTPSIIIQESNKTGPQVILSPSGVNRVSVTRGLPPNAITPEYWWRADSGLTTSSWTAYNGGYDFTLTNVTTANTSSGVVFNGNTGFGITSVLSSNIVAKHVLLRLDSVLVGGNGDSMMGGTQANIHQIGTNVNGAWFVTNQSGSTITYASRTLTTNIISPMPTVLWFNFASGSSPTIYTNNNDVIKATLEVYLGTYNNAFTWVNNSEIYLGRRKEVSGANGFIQMNVKELAIFTSALSFNEIKSFREEMLARWP